MWPRGDAIDPRDVSATALVLSPWVVFLACWNLLRGYTTQQLSDSDPLMQLVEPMGGPWLVVLLAAALTGVWAWRHPPDRAALGRSSVLALAGAAAAAVTAVAIRALVGPELPVFVPPEESSKAGLTLGLSAGLLEEVVFRLGILPLSYAALRARLPRKSSLIAAVAVTSLLFALSHELGPAGGEWEPGYLVTRVVFPGAVMSLLFFRPGPAFIVSAHATAHLLIPALFD